MVARIVVDTRVTLAAAAMEVFFIGGAFFMAREFKKGNFKKPSDPPPSGADGARLVLMLIIDAVAAIGLAYAWVGSSPVSFLEFYGCASASLRLQNVSKWEPNLPEGRPLPVLSSASPGGHAASPCTSTTVGDMKYERTAIR